MSRPICQTFARHGRAEFGPSCVYQSEQDLDLRALQTTLREFAAERARIEAALRKTTSRPGKEASLVAAIASMLGQSATVESEVAIDETGRVAYAFQ